MRQRISAPDRTNLTPLENVRYDQRAQIVFGLDVSFQNQQKVFVCAKGLNEDWFSCKHQWDAEDILKKYHAGEYVSLEWFTEK